MTEPKILLVEDELSLAEGIKLNLELEGLPCTWITRGDEVARGLIEARAVQERDVLMVVRIVGTNAEEAGRLLTEARFETAASLDEAAVKAVAAARAVAS